MTALKSLILFAIAFNATANTSFTQQVTLSDSHSFEAINNDKHSDGLVYGDYEQYFNLGEVVFTRAAGKWNGRTSEYDVIVYNNYPFDICLVPSFEFIKNSREDFYEPSFILGPNSRVELGHYGAIRFGSSWHVKWNFLVSTNLENCAI